MESKKGDLTISVKSIMLVILGLLLGIAIGWIIASAVKSDDGEKRTVTVDGKAEVSAEPDENSFYLSYEEKNADRAVAREAITNKSEAVVKDLIDLGVEENQITSDISTYDNYDYGYDCIDCSEPVGYVAYNNLQVKVSDSELSEKVYNYLLTSDSSGQVTPSSTFSSEKEKQLKIDARKLAVEDAKQQAEQLANELDADIGKAISVEEKQGFDLYYGGYLDEAVRSEPAQQDGATEPARLLTGEQEIIFTVKVEFELK